MTYGEIRHRVVLEAPGVALSLIDGYLLDRYTAILDRLKWQRQDTEVVLQTVAPYTTGTLQVTNGSNALTLTGGTFTSAMTGRAIRIAARDEWYEFTFLTGTTGTLDRAYEGDTDAAASYSIFQNIYAINADCRMLNGLTSPRTGALTRLDRAQINASAGNRQATGEPRAFAPYMDDGSDPPQLQIEVYPVPDAVYSVVVSYTRELAAIAGTGTTILPWVRPSALIAGAISDALEHKGEFARSDRQARKFESYLEDMVRTEALGRGPQPVRAASWLTRHNLQRAIRGATNRTGPRLP